MPNWNHLLKELQDCMRVDALDFIRRKYIQELFELRERNVICYYSGWLQKPGLGNVEIDDNDKNAFMTTIHGLDRTKGLDLLIHTPGGQVAATESVVNYLKKMFNDDIVAFIPQIAMSAGTMMACACKTIVMGKQSNLGPIDPQFNGIPAIGVLDEFKKAAEEIKVNPEKIPLWQVIISKYHPTFLAECENAVGWSKQVVGEWLQSGMFCEEADKELKAKAVVDALSNREEMKAHARHIDIDACKKIGLKIVDLENNPALQDLVLTIHHAFMHTFANSPAIKIVENHLGAAMVLNAQVSQIVK